MTWCFSRETLAGRFSSMKEKMFSSTFDQRLLHCLAFRCTLSWEVVDKIRRAQGTLATITWQGSAFGLVSKSPTLSGKSICYPSRPSIIWSHIRCSGSAPGYFWAIYVVLRHKRIATFSPLEAKWDLTCEKEWVIRYSTMRDSRSRKWYATEPRLPQPKTDVRPRPMLDRPRIIGNHICHPKLYLTCFPAERPA